MAENFKPGAMRKLGLSYDVLESRNPRLVYCAISGFGQDGPYAQYPALDVIVQGMGGVMSTTGEPGGPPVRPGASYGDIAAGLFAAIGILSALLERAVSGRGQFIDTSMLDCQVAVQENAFSRYFASGETPGPLGTRHPIYTPFQAFEASDGWIVVAIVGGRNDQWPLFCATIGRLDLIDDPDFGDGWLRTQHYGRLEPILSEAVRERTIAAWLDAFRSVGIACGPVNDLAQVANDPQVLARGMFVDVMEKGHGPIRAREHAGEAVQDAGVRGAAVAGPWRAHGGGAARVGGACARGDRGAAAREGGVGARNGGRGMRNGAATHRPRCYRGRAPVDRGSQ